MTSAGGGFGLVLGNSYLRLIALLVVLLNVVNTTGEYLVARMLDHSTSASSRWPTPRSTSRRSSASFSGDYQFWVNVVAFAAPGVRHLAPA